MVLFGALAGMLVAILGCVILLIVLTTWADQTGLTAKLVQLAS